MKIKLISICFLLLACSPAQLKTQETPPKQIRELSVIESGKEFWDLYQQIEPIKRTKPQIAIELLEKSFDSAINSFTKSAILLELGELYTFTKQYDKYLKKSKSLIDSGISVFFQLRGKTFPEFTAEYAQNEIFKSLLLQNNLLIERDRKNSAAEYFIQKPDNYKKNKKYPLLIVLHGGVGNIQDMQHYWNSPKLRNEFILAFVQGREFLCSYTRRFGENRIEDITKIYRQIIKDYPVDTTEVILSGPSAGGLISTELVMNNHITAHGLILAFPVKPESLKADTLYAAGLNKLSVSMICGEYDWALKGQKEMSVILDKLKVRNRIVIESGVGHEFPDDFSRQLDYSIEFIRNTRN